MRPSTATDTRRCLAATGIVAAALGLAGCGGQAGGSATAADPAGTGDASPRASTALTPQETTEALAGADSSAGDAADGAADDSDDDPNATLTLANGQTLRFSAMCALEPQEVAGSIIEFTAVSYDDPSLDVTQFGDEGTVQGTAVISVTEGEAPYDTLWDAATLYEVVGGTIDLALDGATITGSGSFYPGGDNAAEPVEGELVVSCSSP